MYGQMLKRARNELELVQNDLTGIGISRVNISDIESGKSKLGVEKACRLYKTLLWQALIKSKAFTFDMDDLFNEEHEYHVFKACHDLILKNKDEDNRKRLLYLIRLLEKNLGNIRFFILKTIAKIHLDNMEYRKAYEYSSEALILGKQLLDVKFLPAFEGALSTLMFSSAKQRKATVFLTTQKEINAFKEKNDIALGKQTHYNIALFLKNEKRYKEALIELEKHSTSEVLLEDRFLLNYLILKSSCLMDTNESEESIEMGLLALKIAKRMNLHEEAMMIASNFIYYIRHYKLKKYNQLSLDLHDLLIDLLKKDDTWIKEQFLIYSNLAYGYYLKKSYDKGMYCFYQAIEAYHNSKADNAFDNIKIIYESYIIFKAGGSLKLLLVYLDNINVKSLDEKSLVLYGKLILNFSMDLKNNDTVERLVIEQMRIYESS